MAVFVVYANDTCMSMYLAVAFAAVDPLLCSKTTALLAPPTILTTLIPCWRLCVMLRTLMKPVTAALTGTSSWISSVLDSPW